MLRYTMARFLVFLAFLSVFYLIGLRDLILVVAALVVSGIVSLFILDKTREAAAKKLTQFFKKTG